MSRNADDSAAPLLSLAGSGGHGFATSAALTRVSTPQVDRSHRGRESGASLRSGLLLRHLVAARPNTSSIGGSQPTPPSQQESRGHSSTLRVSRPAPAASAPLLGSGAAQPMRYVAVPSRVRSYEPPEDAARLLVDFAAGSLLELLAISLVDRQFQTVAHKRLEYELQWLGAGATGSSAPAGFSGLANFSAPASSEQPVLPGRLRRRRNSGRRRPRAATDGQDSIAVAVGAGSERASSASRGDDQFARNSVTTARSLPGLAQILSPQVAQQFVTMPRLELTAPGVTAEASESSTASFFASFAEDDAFLHCQDCNTPIIKADEIISSNYRIMTGRAYLTGAAYNVYISEETHEAHYTTGTYTVKNVSCGHCALRIGITYARAHDRQNNYKVGKFLVGQHLFVRPACCLLRSRRLVADLPTPLCPRCLRIGARGTLQLVQSMTCGLHVGRTRRLYELLLRQHALETIAEPQVTSARGRLLAAPRALVSWCMPLLRPLPPKSEPLARLSLSGMDGAELVGGRLHADAWQATLADRLSMLAKPGCLAVAEGEAFGGTPAAVVRFVGAMCRVARNIAPQGSSKPERVPLLLKLLPVLVAPGRCESLRGARALVLAVRKEWVVSSGHSGGALTSVELESIVAAISARAAANIVEQRMRMRADSAPPALDLDDPSQPQTLELQVECTDKGGKGCLDDSFVTASSTAGDDQEQPAHGQLLQCAACGNPILKVDHILSINYRIMTGLAYLTSTALNVRVSEHLQEAVYTSGHYSVRDVACGQCSAMLGVVYVGAAEAANQHKVGKFLIGKDQLAAPAGAAPSVGEAALHGHLLELMRNGSSSSGSRGSSSESQVTTTTATSSASSASGQVAAMAARGGSIVASPSLVATDSAAASLIAAAADSDDTPLIGGHRIANSVASPFVATASGISSTAAVLAPQSAEAPRQRLIVTIKRYIRCILPAVQYAPVPRPWVSAIRPIAPQVRPSVVVTARD